MQIIGRPYERGGGEQHPLSEEQQALRADGRHRRLSYHHNVWYGGGDSSTIIGGTADITSDPKLFNAGGSAETDYKLVTGSPCINTGATRSTVTTDYWGATRSQPDIGIHEF